MDAPFPVGMMPDIEKFFRDVHPKLTPGQDVYPEVFATDYFFPLQRPKELAAMMRIAREIPGPTDITNGNTWGPYTVMEIGADKGGGLYHWCMCLPSVRNVIACEIRGTPYSAHFESGFSALRFKWLQHSSLLGESVRQVREFLDETPIDVLFIDGDKLGMLKDFEAYLPLMRRPGGVVFMHDVSDDDPYGSFREIMRRGYRTEIILDRSEGLEAAERDLRGEKPRNSHDGWLMHWRGRSCGVGVIYL